MITETETKIEIDDNTTDCSDKPRNALSTIFRVLGKIIKAMVITVDLFFTAIGYLFIILFGVAVVLCVLSIPVVILMLLWNTLASVFSFGVTLLIFVGVISVVGGLYKVSVILR